MPAKPKPRTLAPKPSAPAAPLLADVRDLILTAREAVARTVNAGLTLLYWEIGTRIRREILQEKRAGYGDEILHTLSAQLEAEFGRGFGERDLSRMVRFAEAFPDRQILTSLMSKLGWTHFLHIVRPDDPHLLTASTSPITISCPVAVLMQQGPSVLRRDPVPISPVRPLWRRGRQSRSVRQWDAASRCCPG